MRVRDIQIGANAHEVWRLKRRRINASLGMAQVAAAAATAAAAAAAAVGCVWPAVKS